MKEPLFAGSARKESFWRSATTWITKHSAHAPARAKSTPSRGKVGPAAETAYAGSAVTRIHTAWSVQATKKRRGLGMISLKRLSCPSRMIRNTRNEPRRSAQTSTIPDASIARGLAQPSLARNANKVQRTNPDVPRAS